MADTLRFLLVGLLLLLVAGCANINTIHRSTDLDIKRTALTGSGKAVHLDIQQRLLIIDEIGNYCAEPSPDALAAFAGAIGASASNPAKAAVAGSFAGNSSAASVGLRTQTITLMRDALFRMCEAYANGAVGEAQIAALLNRSQDLTAVVLAVEQLTGATVANQAVLGGQADADATASLRASSELVETLSNRVERQQLRLEDAISRKTNTESALKEAETALATAKSQLTTAQSGGNQPTIAAAQTNVNNATIDRDRRKSELNVAEDLVQIRQRALDKANDALDAASEQQDQAVAANSAGSSGSGQFSKPGATSALDKEASIRVAAAVEAMVTEVIKKDYSLESCMSVITSSSDKIGRDARAFCQNLVEVVVLAKTVESEQRVDIVSRRIAQLSAVRTRANLDDIGKILACASSRGALNQKKLENIFNAANTDGKLTNLKLFVIPQTDKTKLRTTLSQLPQVRGPMAAAAIANAELCKD